MLRRLLFGEIAKGEPLKPLAFRSYFPKQRPSFDEWVKMFNVGRTPNKYKKDK